MQLILVLPMTWKEFKLDEIDEIVRQANYSNSSKNRRDRTCWLKFHAERLGRENGLSAKQIKEQSDYLVTAFTGFAESFKLRGRIGEAEALEDLLVLRDRAYFEAEGGKVPDSVRLNIAKYAKKITGGK
ncbi:hypothetical protein F7734_55780 [Scytonema sp. UIC 10036]|uniref:hypothetical protein n=1 Tax=Scytonema sp. UIC 10036 TaxID=2304196 RepID=UPI0012DA2DE7|nr:hypothetical protein [Scytonema sp. UIC 10036]MUH01041.1 hypothetical protein [Scytonema sp. UIC 10036]